LITVTLYHRSDCPECELIESNLSKLQNSVPHQLVKVNVESDPDLLKVYGKEVPVVQIGPYSVRETFSLQDLLVALGAARDRQNF
jgi:hypothetical protein